MMLARAKLYAIGAVVLAALVAVVLVAWRWHLIDHERNRAAAEAARDFKTTIERIEDADVSTGDADDDLRWLADRLRQVGGR
jgi:uncharacterized membrane protein (DUF106 family)